MKRFILTWTILLTLCVNAFAAQYAKSFEALLTSQRATGATLSGGKAYFYSPGTTTLATIYTTRAKTTPAANPYTLSSDGTASVFGDGVYDVKITTSTSVQKAYWYGIELKTKATDAPYCYASADLTLAQAAVSADCANNTVVVTTALTSGFSNISSASVHSWPTDRKLRVETGGSIANSTIFKGAVDMKGGTFSGTGRVQVTGISVLENYHMFTGSGAVTGLKEVRPEWFGAYTDGTHGAETRAAIQKAIDSLPGAVEPTLLSLLTPGGAVVLGPGIYAVDSGLVVTKSNTIVKGAGPQNTTIKYTGTGLITDIIKFKDTNYSELSEIALDGNASSASQGAKSCLGTDLAVFFTSKNLYLLNSTMYGMRNSNLWESYIDQLQVRATGLYSTVGDPGASIYFGPADATSTVFPDVGYGSNNTTFVKPTLVPYGGLVRAVGAYITNISFINPITETTPGLADTAATKEVPWFIESSVFGLNITGGYFGGNPQVGTSSPSLFHIVGNDHQGITIKDYYISIPDLPGYGSYPKIDGIFDVRTNHPITVENVTINDPKSAITYVFGLGGAAYAAPMYGSVMYSTDGTTPRDVGDLFTASSRQFFQGRLTIRNGDSTAAQNSFKVYDSQTAGSQEIAFANSPYTANSNDNVLLVNATGGETIVYVDSLTDKPLTIKKTDATANAVTMVVQGGGYTFNSLGAAAGGSYSITTARASATLIKKGTVVYVMD